MSDQYQLIEVKSKSDLYRWIKFPHQLYLGDKNFIPQVISDEKKFFNPKINPSFNIAEVKLLLVIKNNQVAGRVAGIINSLEVKKLGIKRGRFGWFETIDDHHVTNLLLTTVKDWLLAQGCTEMTGPHGFTDLDPEGLLVDGFNELPTISGSYNFPYYQQHLEDFGFSKDVDYIEYKINFPVGDPFFERVVVNIDKDPNYYILPLKKRKDLLSRAEEFWEILESSFYPLYGVTPLSKEQQNFYTSRYLSFLDLDFVKFAYRRVDNKMVGFFIGMPNVSKGFQRAGGRLLPLGIFHILREFKRSKNVDFLLAGVDPSLPAKKILLLLTSAMYRACRDRGIGILETNRELETNTNVNGIWTRYDSRLHRRSRIFKLSL